MKQMSRIVTFLLLVLLMLLMGPAALAAAQLDNHVTDSAYLVTDEEWAVLDARASEISERYSCGVYIITVNDFLDFGDTPYEAADRLRAYFELGCGESGDCALLLLSMADRDYALIAHGDFGNAAFTDYGKEVLAEHFLEKFADDDWYGGFEAYLDKSEAFLAMAQAGTPFDVDNDPDAKKEFLIGSLLMIVLIPSLIAGVVCMIWKNQMQSVQTQTEAAAYVVADSNRLRICQDQFLSVSQQRRKIQKSDDTSSSGRRGGTTVDSNGTSGHSGKF